MAAQTRQSATRRQGPLRVVVAADQTLVAQSVGLAISERSYDVFVLRWPGSGPGRPRRRTTLRADVGLLISELDRPARIHAARLVVQSLKVPWLVLTGAPSGPLWGAVLESGATLILPTTTTLDEVTVLLDDVVADPRATRTRRARSLVRAWQELVREREETADRLRTLTPREEDVLAMLYVGASVRTIAELFGTTLATVRGHVQAILRKLDVNSQVAAVAAYQMLQEDPTEPFRTGFAPGPEEGKLRVAAHSPHHWV